jgi:hypothetical protein
LKNLEALCALANLTVLLGKEFVDWVWWYNWGDGDEDNPAPILSATWSIWCKVRGACSWLWSKFWWVPQRWLTGMWRRNIPAEPFFEPMDQDGRTPTEWLLIEVIGVWDMENWYKDEYDWEVRRKWEELFKARAATEDRGGDKLSVTEPLD